MRIGIDAYEANQEIKVGIGRYAFELLWQLYYCAKNDDIILFVPNQKLPDLPPQRPGWEYRIVPSRSLWTFFALPHAIKKETLDVFFSPTHYIPLVSSVPRTFSIMDLSYVRFSSLFQFKDRLKLRFGTQYSVRTARKIFTISHFSKQEICDFYGIAQDRVVVTYPGFNSSLFRPYHARDIQPVLKKYTLEKDYIISIGTIQPRKNIVRLLKAFESLKNRKEKLLILGKKGWLYKEILSKIRNLERTGKVQYLDFVPDQDLPLLLAGARCFVSPSLYEGFGLPAVEAMACGVPVVVSNISSLPEIVGNAGILVDPYSIGSIASGISQAFSLTSSQRKTIIQKGFVQSQQFNWRTCAQLTLQGLQSVTI